jgi:hypothetical protein
MRISKMTTHVVGTPWRDLTFVQLFTDDGLVGVGAQSHPSAPLVTSLKPSTTTCWAMIPSTSSRWSNG